MLGGAGSVAVGGLGSGAAWSSGSLGVVEVSFHILHGSTPRQHRWQMSDLANTLILNRVLICYSSGADVVGEVLELAGRVSADV